MAISNYKALLLIKDYSRNITIYNCWAVNTFHYKYRGVVGYGEGVVYLTDQLILAYSWARLAILVAGKGRGECFYLFCFSPFVPVPLSSLSLSCIYSTISFLPFSERRHKMTHKG